MLPQVRPVGGTSIAWDVFLQACVQSLGYSPIRGVDSLKRELSDPAKLLAAIAGFHNKLDVDTPIKSIREASTLLKHLSYMFLVYADEPLVSLIRERTDLNITSTVTVDSERLILISGTLKQYLEATVECCVENAPRELCYLFDAFILYFDQIGLGDIWYQYRRKPRPDKTFLIEYKP